MAEMMALLLFVVGALLVWPRKRKPLSLPPMSSSWMREHVYREGTNAS